MSDCRELKSDGWKDLDLSTREKDIIALRMGGASPKEAALRLNVSEGFVHVLEQKVKKAFGNQYLNVNQIDRESVKEMKFRKIVNAAMQEMGLTDLEEKAEFLDWAIGADYATVPYQNWPYRLSSNVSMLNIGPTSPVKAVIRAACEIWKSQRLIVRV